MPLKETLTSAIPFRLISIKLNGLFMLSNKETLALNSSSTVFPSSSYSVYLKSKEVDDESHHLYNLIEMFKTPEKLVLS